MILHAEFLVIGVRGNVQHVLDPVVAVGHLDFVPVHAAVLEAAVPVKFEAKQVEIETILRSRIFDDESSVNEGCADAVVRRNEIRIELRAMDKRKGIAFGVAQLKVKSIV